MLVSYPFSFAALSASDVGVTMDADGSPVTLVKDSSFLLTLNPDQSSAPGGSIQYAVAGVAAALPLGYTLTISGATPYEQQTRLPQGGSYNAKNVEQAFDRQEFQLQQLLEIVGRSLKLPLSDPAGTPTTLPAAAQRAGQIQGYDVNGNPTTYPLAFVPTFPVPTIDVRNTGADGLGLVADDLAFDVALSMCAALGGGCVGVSPGLYRLDAPKKWYRSNFPRVDIEVRGYGQLSSVIRCNYFSATDAVFSSVDPAGVGRSSPLSFYDLGFEHASSAGVNPPFIDILGWGESRLRGVRFGASNNTVLRGISAQNVRGYDVVSFFGGRHFNYKDTTGLTFSVNSGTKTIVSSGPIFSVGDTGRFFFPFSPDGSRRIRYTLTYVDSTHATFTEAGLDETSIPGHFEPARGSIASGSKVFNVNANCFTSDMVGMVLAIQRADAGAFGAAILRSRIALVNAPNSVTLADAADNTVTNVEFGVPCFDFGTQAGFAGSSDVRLEALHIEHYRGVALLLQNCDTYYISGKIHGETAPSSTQASLAAVWADDVEGHMHLWLDSTCSMAQSRMHVCNQNTTLKIDLTSRGTIHQEVLSTDLFTDVGGRVWIPYYLSLVDFPNDIFDTIIDSNRVADATDPRVLVLYADMLGDGQSPRIYTGRDTYFTIRGEMIGGQVAALANIPTLTWNGTPPAGTKLERYSWRKTNKVCHFRMRGKYGTPGVTNSSLIIPLPADMPAPASDSTLLDEIIGANVTGAIGTAANASPSLCKAFLIGDGVGGFQVDVVLNSGTVSAAFFYASGSYETA